jgi:hypothetical protein
MDAAILIYNLELFKQARSILDRAAEMILIAPLRAPLPIFTRQLLTAVIFERWWVER